MDNLLKWLRSKETSRKEMPEVDEDYEIKSSFGHTILQGRFIVGNQTIQVSHSQWEGDSYPMSLKQRKQILRMTVLERIKKTRPFFLSNK